MVRKIANRHVARLLGDGDPEPFSHFEFDRERAVLVVCDHAGQHMPRALANLGLAEHHLRDHIAWDIGAGAVARRLAERLGATLIAASYSRLVVDLNRAETDPSLIPPISDGILIPGNIGLTAENRCSRIEAIFVPYHSAIDGVLNRMTSTGKNPVMIAIHSFTPRISGVWRPWHAGVLWDKDPRIAVPLLEALRARGDVVIGDNEPYSGRHTADYTIDRHAEGNGLPYAAIEIRQDQIQTSEGQSGWSERIFDAVMPILNRMQDTAP